MFAVLGLLLAAALTSNPAQADEAKKTYEEIEQTLGLVPSFLKAYPESGIAGAWKAMKGVQLNPDSALSAREKELIALAVAAQIPCDYCVYFHTTMAKDSGATKQEIKETLAIAATIRHWSTILNGSQIDLKEFKEETDKIRQFVSDKAGD